MRAFSQLLDDLVYTRSRNAKLRLIGEYLKETPDPDPIQIGGMLTDTSAQHRLSSPSHAVVTAP